MDCCCLADLTLLLLLLLLLLLSASPADRQHDQMAVCSYVTRSGGPPYLVALLPQPVELYEDENGNVSYWHKLST